MFATTGTVRPATTVKSGRDAAAPWTGTVTGRAGVVVWAARSLVPVRILPVRTTPTAKPHVRNSTAKIRRRDDIGSGHVDTTRSALVRLRADDSQHPVSQLGGDEAR